MNSCITLFGADILKLMSDFAIVCCQRLAFEQFEDPLAMVILAA